MAHFILFCFLLASVFSHGRLISPLPRGHNLGDEFQRVPIDYETDAVTNTQAGFTGGSDSPTWVCRGFDVLEDSEITTITAGGEMTLTWSCSACHPGDCAFYISYDWDPTKTSRSEMRWFKIGNFLDCLELNDNPRTRTIQIPDWLPSGRAVFRWGWYATHLWPRMEFYVQCVDILIANSDDTKFLNLGVEAYSLIDPTALYPTDFDEEAGPYNEKYWRVESGRSRYMTGPACAAGFEGNSCSETSTGNYGNLVPVVTVDLASIYAAPDSTTTTTTTEYVDLQICLGYTFVGGCNQLDSFANNEPSDNAGLCKNICSILPACTSWLWNIGTTICNLCTNTSPELKSDSSYSAGIRNTNCPTSSSGDTSASSPVEPSPASTTQIESTASIPQNECLSGDQYDCSEPNGAAYLTGSSFRDGCWTSRYTCDSCCYTGIGTDGRSCYDSEYTQESCCGEAYSHCPMSPENGDPNTSVESPNNSENANSSSGGDSSTIIVVVVVLLILICAISILTWYLAMYTDHCNAIANFGQTDVNVKNIQLETQQANFGGGTTY